MTNEDVIENNSSGFILGNNLYNKLKWFVQIVLPALGVFYFSFGQLWGLPNVEQVLGSIAAISTLLGTVLGLSSRTYNNSDLKYSGIIEVFDRPENDKKTYSIMFDGDVEDMDKQDEVTFKVFKR